MSDQKQEVQEVQECGNCKVSKSNLLRCAQCKSMNYCSKECQKQDWQKHKINCEPPKQKQKIDDYDINELIGEAFHKPTKQIRALKMAEKKKLIKLHKEKELFVEKHCLKILEDVEEVVDIYETFQDDFSLYLSMEFIQGKELWNICNVYGIKDKNKIKFYFYKILQAFKKLHERDIVHRDIKPENIMIEQDTERIKLVDFGSAKDLKNNVQSKGNSSTGRKYFEHFMGTPNYMAPECIRNQFSDKRCDIYSLGAILYNMITGFPPYLGGSDYLIFKQIMDKKQPKFYDFLFDEFEIQLIQKMMSFDAEDRPDIDEVLQECDKWKDIKVDENNQCKQQNFFEKIIQNFQKRDLKPTKEELKLEFEPLKQNLFTQFEKEENFRNLRRHLKYIFQQVLHFYNLKDFEFPDIEVDQLIIVVNYEQQKKQLDNKIKDY